MQYAENMQDFAHKKEREMTMDELCCEVKAKPKSYIKTNLYTMSP